MENNPEIEHKAYNLKKEIQNISFKLKELGGQKEEHYKQKNSLDKTLSNLISRAKELKDKKREIDKEIHKLKKERDAANKQYNKTISEFKSAQKERRELKRKQNITPSSELRNQIKALEYKIQTEAVSFKKEKQIMDQIRKIRAELKNSLAQEEKFNSRTDFNRTKNAKKNADKIHAKIQKLANESSQIFDELTKLSKDISDIKAKRNTVKLVLNGLKMQIRQMNRNLAKILKDWSGIADKVVFQPARKGIDLLLHKKTEEVKDKLKKKKKLTTDDILLLQREHLGK